MKQLQLAFIFIFVFLTLQVVLRNMHTLVQKRRGSACECLPEGQQFGVSVCFLQHSFHQLLVFLRIHRARAVNHGLNLLDCQGEKRERGVRKTKQVPFPRVRTRRGAPRWGGLVAFAAREGPWRGLTGQGVGEQPSLPRGHRVHSALGDGPAGQVRQQVRICQDG